MTPPKHFSSTSSGLALFIYYRVDAAHSEALASATRAMQADLARRHPGLSARLWIRADALGKEQTWMESYEHPRGVAGAVHEAIEVASRELPAGRVGERHTETFVSV